jgi:hypothetical protein
MAKKRRAPKPPKLTDAERCDRWIQLSEAYIPYLRERHPMGSVVAINLQTAEYVVGACSPEAMDLYNEKFPDAEADMYIEPIHWPDTRPMSECLATAQEWLQRRNAHRNDAP